MELKDHVKVLKEHQKKSRAYAHALSLLSYDAATSMPAGASDTLGDTMAVLSAEAYRLDTEEAYKTSLKEVYRRRVEVDFQTGREAEELLEALEKREKIPEEAVMEEQIAVNQGNHYWEIAKREKNFNIFAPYLARLIEIKKRYARCLAPHKDVYDTLLNEFEKGMTQAQMDPFFENLRQKLVPLIQKISEADKPDTSFLHQHFPAQQQKLLSEYVMEVMGIDKNRCILRETEHPFTTEFSKNDVRITTKYVEDDLASNLFSVIHESGHAMYELSIDDRLLYSVLGQGATTAIHESQSRLWENSIGRNLPFCRLIFPKIKELFPVQMRAVTAEDFHRAVNAAQPSLIRTDADELTYSLHVLIRYELEKKIFHDQISVEELPEEWNRLYQEYLGIEVPDSARGVLQDAHWAGGAFGYFPSYALGTAYSAQIAEALRQAVDVDQCCLTGNFEPVRSWLTEKIYRHGMLLTAGELIENTCGRPFDPACYTKYLTEKYTELYHL